MKYLALVILMAFAGLCCKKELVLIDAVCSVSVSGKEGLKNEKYIFSFVTPYNSEKISVTGLWIMDRSMDFRVFSLNHNIPTNEFAGNDTIFMSCEQVIWLDDNVETVLTPDPVANIKPPQNYEGKALVEYMVGNRKKYFCVEEIRTRNMTLKH